MAPMTDNLVFKVNYDGVFVERPFRYVYGLNLEWKLPRSKRICYSEMCDLLVDTLEDNIWALSYCVPECSLGEGFTIVESNGDMNKMYKMADLFGLIELYVAHTPQNLALWYYKNLCLDGSDEAATSKRKVHEIRLKDAISMSFEELVAWEKEEARSPYLRSPLKFGKKNIEFKGKLLFEDLLRTDCVVDEGVGYNSERPISNGLAIFQGVAAEGVGYDDDTIQAVGNDVLGDDGVIEKVVADNSVLGVGGSRVRDVGGSCLLGLPSSRVLAETGSSVGDSRKIRGGATISRYRRLGDWFGLNDDNMLVDDYKNSQLSSTDNTKIDQKCCGEKVSKKIGGGGSSSS